jgi:hypothetical protein
VPQHPQPVGRGPPDRGRRAGRAGLQAGESSQQQRREQEGDRVDGEHATGRDQWQQHGDQHRPGHLEPVAARAEGGVGPVQVGVVDQVGDRAAGGRGEGGGQHRLDREQHRQPGQGRVGEHDRPDRGRLAQLAHDHQQAPPDPVGDQPEQRAQHRRRALAGQQQHADVEPAAALLGHEQDERHQPGRVAEQGHEAGQPQPAERARPAHQFPARAPPAHAWPARGRVAHNWISPALVGVNPQASK